MSSNSESTPLNGGKRKLRPSINSYHLIDTESYGSTARNSKKSEDVENPKPRPTSEKPEPEKPGEKYGISDAYKWLYGALSRQPMSRGLPASALALVAIAGEGFLVTQPAVFLGQIVDSIGQSGVEGDAWPLFMLIGASLVGKEVCTFSRKYIVEGQATALQKGAFLEQSKHLLSVRVDALQDRRVGDLAVRLDKSVEGLIKLTKETFMEAIPNIMTAFFALGLAANAHWSVGVAMVGAVTAGAGVTVLQVNSQKGIRISLNERKAELGGSIAEMLGNLPYIRASGMRENEERRLEDGAESLRATEFLHHKYMMSFHGTKDLIEGLGFTVVVGVAISLALRGDISSGDILTLSMLYSKAAQPIAKMHKVVDQIQESCIKIGALSAVRNLPVDPSLAGSLLPRDDADVVPFIAADLDVTLGKDAKILNKLSLDIQRGTIVGLAGTSGSGKSTLLKAALGLIPDYEGSLRLFEVETKELEKQALSHRIAYAQQEPFVLTGSLRDNLLLTQPFGLEKELDLSDSALLRALERSCLGPADHDWPNGLDTHIHEAGRNLSGGQRQRLVLARIFLQQQAELIILDEATSALDNATESRIIEELHAHAAATGRTVLMVAHRLTTLRGANRVLVMDEGKIVQDGSYEDLASMPGVFRELLEYNK